MTMLRRTFTGAVCWRPPSASPALAADVTVKYMTFSAAPDYIEELDATIAAFEAAHPDINVNTRRRPSATISPSCRR